MSFQVREFGSGLYINNELNWVPHHHIHNHVEFVYLTRGSFTAIVDNQTYTINEGELLLVFPHQIHYYHTEVKLEGYVAVFSPNLFQKMKSIFRKKTPEYPILHKHQLSSDIPEIIAKLYKNYKCEDFYSGLVSEGCLLQMLGEILPLFTYKENVTDQDTVKQLLLYCMENYTGQITLDILARKFNLSPTYISRLFHERMHLSYIDFINKLRVNHACSILEKGCNITEVAFASGFSSISTFNRIFLKQMHMSPREYIKAKH